MCIVNNCCFWRGCLGCVSRYFLPQAESWKRLTRDLNLTLRFFQRCRNLLITSEPRLLLIDRSLDQSVNRSNGRSVNQLINQSINQPIKQFEILNRSLSQSVNQSINRSIDRSIDHPIDQSIDRSSSQSSRPIIKVLKHPNP